MSKQGRTGACIFSGLVLLGTAAFATYALGTQKAPGTASQELAARFVSANGLSRGADVDLAGVRVGRVTSGSPDPPSQMAIVHFRLNANLPLPQARLLALGSSTLTPQHPPVLVPSTSGPAPWIITDVFTNSPAPTIPPMAIIET